jgi:hypothetical protein
MMRDRSGQESFWFDTIETGMRFLTPRNAIHRKLSFREIRWLCYLAVVLVVAAWRYLPRPWHPTEALVVAHLFPL